MNFGSLQIATLWRLSKAGVTCDGLVVDGVKELRLIITEGGHIVHWERFPTAGQLRRRALTILRARKKCGWRATDGASTVQGVVPAVVASMGATPRARGVQGTLHGSRRAVTAADS